ncbi:hypothetical protein PRNP1_011155 [Phytophthora ramorum]
MSVPQQSMPPVSQYAPKPTVAGHSDSTSTTPASNAMNTSSSGAPAAAATAAVPGTGGGVAGATVGTTVDWRDKDADRGARQQIARIILTLIMKSANRPTSANYNPREIARRLEHTLYMGAPSKQEYSNVQTLKARLQQALDNSRRRQMQQQQARLQQQLQAPGASTDAVQQQTQAQLLQQRQMALLQRQQQQQMAAALHNQRANFQAVPFPGVSGAMNQSALASQPLQMPVNMSQVAVKTPGSIAAVSTAPGTVALSPGNGAAAGNSILDELEREADEMANGVNDQPLSMPESELQAATTPTGTLNAAIGNNFVNLTPTSASPTIVGAAGTGSFSAAPLSMPPDISSGVASPATSSSAGLAQLTPAMISAASATAGTNTMYNGMNLTGPQIQQIQQIQQMQQLRRMQQLQQLQQQQLNGKVSAAQLQAGATVPTSGVSTTPTSAAGGSGVTPGMIQMNEVSIAQKREELKRRLIQLKHARTCGSDQGQKSGAGASVTASKESSLLDEMKKKPLKLQTEKEKKLRRKEQAKIAKARAQAKAAAAAALTGPVAGALPTPGAAQPVMHNGLVVRGTQAELRGDHHVSHQDISFLDSMTEGQLDEHIRSLRFNFCGHISIAELKSRLMPLLTKLMDSEYGWTFNNPVDPVQWNIPDYFDIIKCPMDLGTIKKRLESEHYNSVEAFAGDVRLVFENCIAYNSSTNKFNIAAKQLLASFNKSLASLKNQLEKQLFKRCEQRREEMCQLCGGDSFKFAPCMLFCSGPCAGRIRRHTHYYSDPRGEHHWCSSCYKQMKEGPIDMSLLPQLSSAATEVAPPPGAALFDGVLKKSSLVKRKNSEVAEEPWVECDSCKLWYHQICALFNERNHAISGEQEPFVCPICVKKQRATGVKPSLDNGLKAKRLPITRMAKLIETRVMEAIEKAGKDEAVRMGSMGNSDSIGFSNGVKESASDTQFGITIREVLSIDKQVQVKPRMAKLLAAKYGKTKKAETGATATQSKSLKRPRSTMSAADKKAAASASASSALSLQLTYRSRCICVFQELDGVDVLIFTLYVQEYGADSLSPNAGRVYVSYLDSVNYFQPKKLRTLMHQQVMLGFLEDCKNRGFHTCHIWSCPPLKGDDYIFFCKPENQKIPKSARLRQWYQKLLQQAKHDGLVANMSNLYAEYYMKKKAAHELPYFEGDYWPRLAEDLIKQLEEKDNGNRVKTGTPGQVDAAGNMASASGASTPANGAKTPITRSPSPSDASNENDVATDSATDVKATASKKGAMTPGSKNKSKRSKKGAPTEPSVTRSSASKARSKKGDKSSRSASSSKNVINNDPLMQKLKGILEPQKDDFFVVDLYPKCHKCGVPIVHEGYWELKTIPPPASVNNLLEATKKTRSSSSSSRNSPPRHYHYFYCGSCYDSNKTQLLHRVEVSSNCAKRARDLSERILPLNEKAAAAELAELDLQEIKFEAVLNFVDTEQEVEEETQVKDDDKSMAETKQSEELKTEKSEDKTRISDVDANVSTEASDTAATEASNKPADENAESRAAPATEKAADASSNKEKQTEENHKATEQTKETIAVTAAVSKKHKHIGAELDDLIMPCEIFDTREAFLLYCQNNHCQFDQIRRAKHSSMMVLYHLFNQGTTGFTFSCSNCKTTLLSGNRWNCSICPVFNLCDTCHTKTKHEHQLHLFKVVSIPRPGNEVSNETVSTKVKGVVSTAGGAAGRAIKREAGSSDLKRAKHAKGAGKKAGGSRKRKLHQPSSLIATPTSTTPAVKPEVAAAPATVPEGAEANAAPDAAAAASASADSAANGANGNTSDGDAAKKRRIHNIDPQLLLQLEHASSCTAPNCTFFNCNRMQAMLKHGAICEQRLAGPCVLCKRIIGLLSAHARQCTKDYASCKVPRCADIRRHFLAQVQARQQQLQRARQLQAQQQAMANAATAATTPATGEETKDAAAS